MEAYSEVYAPQEKIDEGLRSAVKRLLGGGKKETEAPKPESRGEQLRKKYNVGPEKSDTSAKRQILDRSRARAERDEKEFGGSKYSKSVAQKSKAAHDRYLKAGYSKYGADDARGSGNAARKRAATLNREEFEFIVNALIEEGYDLSSYTYDEMYDICLDEAVKGASRHDTEMRKASAAERRGGDKRLSPSKGKQNADKMERDVKYMDKLSKNNKIIVGMAHEELDIFDVVLEFLQVEGYAETLEEAEWIMANELDAEDIEEILEAEGSYGQTPKARTAMGKLAISRMRKPATEYSQKGEKTKKVKAAEKQTRRQDVLSRGLSGGKKSSRPRYSGGRGKMDADERAERRAERAFDGENTYGAGSVTKNPKKLRKQKAMGEH